MSLSPPTAPALNDDDVEPVQGYRIGEPQQRG